MRASGSEAKGILFESNNKLLFQMSSNFFFWCRTPLCRTPRRSRFFYLNQINFHRRRSPRRMSIFEKPVFMFPQRVLFESNKITGRTSISSSTSSNTRCSAVRACTSVNFYLNQIKFVTRCFTTGYKKIKIYFVYSKIITIFVVENINNLK